MTDKGYRNRFVAVLVMLMALSSGLFCPQFLAAEGRPCDRWGCCACRYDPDTVTCGATGPYYCECCTCTIIKL